MDRNDRSEAKEAFGKQPASWSSIRSTVENCWCIDAVDWKAALQIVGKQLCTDASDEAARKLIMKKVEESVLMIDAPLLGGG